MCKMCNADIASVEQLQELIEEAAIDSENLEQVRAKEGWHGSHYQNMAIYIGMKYGLFGYTQHCGSRWWK